jgi:hypothetical protein
LNNKQEKEELMVFNKFASIYPCSVNASSIENRKPPHPDIYCTVRDGRSTAFELLEIIDKEYARTLSASENIRRTIQQKIDKLPDADKKKFVQKSGDTHISFKFRAKISQNSILNSLGSVINYLLALPPQAGFIVLNKKTFLHHVSQTGERGCF